MKLTDWFPIDMKPERVGVYRVRHSGWVIGGMPHSLWDGAQWNSCGGSPEMADRQGRSYGRSADCYDSQKVSGWRGLAEDPNLPPSEPTHV